MVNWEKKQVSIDEKTSTVLYHHGSHMLDVALWFAGDELADIHIELNPKTLLLNCQP